MEKERIKYNGELIHSTGLEGVMELFENFDPEMEVCFSTYGSINRGFELVYEAQDLEGEYSPCDMDAGRNYGYDEFRALVPYEFIKKPKKFLVDQVFYNWIFRDEENEHYGDDDFRNIVYRFIETYALHFVMEIKGA